MEPETFILEITWEREGMPRHVGPFTVRAEAEAWAALNIPNGSWQVCPVTYPYARGAQR